MKRRRVWFLQNHQDDDHLLSWQVVLSSSQVEGHTDSREIEFLSIQEEISYGSKKTKYGNQMCPGRI